MYIHKTQIRTRYAETDQMGFIYYGNYAQYFEIGRVEALRNIGMSYRELEGNGIMLPVIDFQVNFYKPAFYDEILTIVTKISELPLVRIKFEYETINEREELINKASTTLVFIDRVKNKPCKVPDDFLLLLNKFF